MDSQQFDRFAKVFGARLTRRQSMTAIAGAAAVATGFAQTTGVSATILPCVITCPENPYLTASDGTCTAIGEIPAPTDNGSCGDQAIICTPSSDSAFPVGSTDVTCQTANASATCSYTLYVYDGNDIVIICPPDQSLEVAGPTAVTFDDPIPGTVCEGFDWLSWTCDANSGDTFALGTTTVTCSINPGSKIPEGIDCSFQIALALAPTATPTETEIPTATPTEDLATDVPGVTATPTDIPATLDPATEIPAPSATAPVTSLPNTGSGSDGGASGVSNLLPLAVVGAGAVALVRLGLRKPAETPEA